MRTQLIPTKLRFTQVRFNEAWLRCWRPLYLFPLFILPLQTFFFSFFFSCLLRFHVLSSHFFLSFARAPVRPLGVRACVLLTQASGRPGLDNEVGFHCFSLVIWFPLHRNHLHLCPVVSSFHVFISCPFCARPCTFVSPLVFGPPRRWGGARARVGVCVCVCV